MPFLYILVSAVTQGACAGFWVSMLYPVGAALNGLLAHSLIKRGLNEGALMACSEGMLSPSVRHPSTWVARGKHLILWWILCLLLHWVLMLLPNRPNKHHHSTVVSCWHRYRIPMGIPMGILYTCGYSVPTVCLLVCRTFQQLQPARYSLQVPHFSLHRIFVILNEPFCITSACLNVWSELPLM